MYTFIDRTGSITVYIGPTLL